MVITNVNPGEMSRDEALAANISGLPHPELQKPLDRVGLYLGNLAGIVPVEDLPKRHLSNVEWWLAYICGVSPDYPDNTYPGNKIEVYLASIAGVYEDDLPEPTSRLEFLLKQIADEKNSYVVASMWGDVIVVYGAMEEPLEDLRIFGRSSLYRETTGAQLLNDSLVLNLTLSNAIGVKAIYFNNYTELVYSGKLIQSVSYRLSFFIEISFQNFIGKHLFLNSKPDHYINRFMIATQNNETLYKNDWIVTGSEKAINIQSVIENSANLEPGTHLEGHIKIMLNEGTSSLPWEPYTGTDPSPNPDYPCDIDTVAGPNNILKDIGWNKGFITNVDVGETPEFVDEEVIFPNSIYSDPIYINYNIYNIDIKRYDNTDGFRVRFFDQSGRVSRETYINSDIQNNIDFGESTSYIRILILNPENIDFSHMRITPVSPKLDITLSGGNLFDSSLFVIKDEYKPYITRNEDGSFTVNGLENVKQYSTLVNSIHMRNLIKPNTLYMIKASAISNKSPMAYIQIAIKFSDAAISDIYMINSGTFSISDKDYTKIKEILISMQTNTQLGLIENQTVYFSITEVSDIPYTPYRTPQLMKIQPKFTYGLPGIKMDDNYNGEISYENQNGKWVSDEVDFSRGIYIKRIKRVIIDSTNSDKILSTRKYATNGLDMISPYRFYMGDIYIKSSNLISSDFPNNKHLWISPNEGCYTTESTIDFKILNRRFGGEESDTPSESKTKIVEYLKTHSFYFYGVASTPEEIPLTQEELSEYVKLIMYAPTTQLLNSDNAYMKLDYKTKNVSRYRMRRR